MIYDLLIIGGATSGLTAGIYAARKKLKTVIITKQVGGQSLLTNTIENFPGFESISGIELIGKMRKQCDFYGVEIRENEEVESVSKDDDIFLIRAKNKDIKSNKEDVDTIKSRSVIIATGKNYRHLNVPGEREFENRGVSYCSTCDAPLFRGKDVAVIGGGNSGLNAALDLLKYARKIYVLEMLDKIRGDEILQEKLKESGRVEFITKVQIKEIKGSKFVEKVIFNNREIEVQGVFINIGWEPATSFLKNFVDLNEYGEIIINPRTNETSIKGVFAAGDCTDVLYKQCIIAAGEGAKAALSAYGYLKEKF